MKKNVFGLKFTFAFAIIACLILLFGLPDAKQIQGNEPPSPLTKEEKTLLETLSGAFAKLSQQVKPSVVSITTTKTVKVPQFFDPFEDDLFRFFEDENGQRPKRAPQQREFKQSGLGSGVIVSADGYILTNNHVVEGASELRVRLSDGRTLDAKLIGGDRGTDLAVLKIDAKDLPVAVLGNSDKLVVGNWVIAVGSPFGWEQTVSKGIVSAKGRSLDNASIVDFIQTDAAINPGNSGGPLLDIDGKVVGINTAIATRLGSFSGIGFAIPVNLAKTVMNSLIKHGKFTRAVIGIKLQPVSSDIAEALGMPKPKGAMVAEVVPGSPAEKAGVKAGDIITTLNGEEISSIAELPAKISVTEPGQKVKLGVTRMGDKGSQNLTLEVTVAAEDKVAGFSESSGVEPGTSDELGMTLQNLTPDLAEQFKLGKNASGVLVSAVKEGSPAEQAGIKAGDVILSVVSKDVKNIAEFKEAVKNVKGAVVLLRIKRGDTASFVTIKRKS